jgi:RimJ/RimL family protein N-acetyltransferase
MTEGVDQSSGEPVRAASPGRRQDRASARLRLAGPGDAAALLRLKQRLDQESSFMLFEPGERDASVDILAAQLSDTARSRNSAVIVAELDGDLAGYVEVSGGSFRRTRSTAYLVIGVVAAASGRGIGRSLLEEAKRWAAAHGVHRLELTVMSHNRRAAGLYRRAGFTVEGRRAQCLLVDGQFVDELYMAAILLPGHQMLYAQASSASPAEANHGVGDEQDGGEDQARVLGPGQHRMPASPPPEPGAPAQIPGHGPLEPAETEQRPGQHET